MTRDDVEAMLPVAQALEALDVPYYIGGSVASSTHGTLRSTEDIDLVANLRSEHVAPFVAHLAADYYVDAEMIREAIRARISFNIIHLPTMYKVDVFIAKPRAFDREAWGRTRSARPFEQTDRAFPIASAEDVILNKLEWFRQGGETSERQWLDVIGVIRVQDEALDRQYLSKWAAELGVADLLDRAFAEAVI